ncbi:MAG: alpha/beta fold hydrolase [Pseudomonadota bacterium]
MRETKTCLAGLVLCLSVAHLTGCTSLIAKRIVEPPRPSHDVTLVSDDNLQRVNSAYAYARNTMLPTDNGETVAVTVLAPTRFDWTLDVEDVGDGVKVFHRLVWNPSSDNPPLDFSERLAGSKGTVVLLHGYRMERSLSMPWGALFADAGLTAVLVDLPGHGQSPRRQVTFGALEASYVNALADSLKRQGYPAPYVLFGISLGATTALRSAAARDDQWDAVLAFEPFEDVAEVIDNVASDVSWPLRWLMTTRKRAAVVEAITALTGVSSSDMRVVPALTHYRTPTLVLHSQQDDWIPYAQVQRIAATSAHIALWLYPNGGDHLSFPTPFWRYCAPIFSWLEQTLYDQQPISTASCARLVQALSDQGIEWQPSERIIFDQ